MSRYCNFDRGKGQNIMNSIKSKLVVVILFLVLVPFTIFNCIGITFIFIDLEKYIMNNNRFLANNIAENVKLFVGKAYCVTEEITYNSDVRSFIPDKQKKVILNTLERNPYFDLLYIQGTDGIQTARSTGMPGDRSNRWWFEKVMQEKVPFVGKSYYSLNGNIPVTPIIFPIYDDISGIIGVMGADIKLDALQQLVEKFNIGNGSYAYILDGEGVVIAHPHKKQVLELYNYKTLEKEILVRDSDNNAIMDEKGNHKTIKQKIEVPEKLKGITLKALEGESGIIEYKDSTGELVVSAYTTVELPGNSDNWCVITVQNKSAAMSVILNIIERFITVTLILVLITVIIAYFISNKISKPLVNLKKALSEVSSGNLMVRVDVNSRDEIGDVGNSFNNMIIEIRNLIAKVHEEHIMREKARLEALQAQINPHFLFNTLNTIKWAAIMSKANNIAKLIGALGKLLEVTVNGGGEFITVSEETECLKSYILIQRARYNDKFKINYSIEQDTLCYKVPKLILQPLVENSILHGFEGKEGLGIIEVHIEKSNNLLLIYVVDNGVGIPQEKIETLLLKTENNKEKGRFSGIGLKNVDERIKLNYGDDYGVEIKSVVESGTTVKVTLPLIDEGDKLHYDKGIDS